MATSRITLASKPDARNGGSLSWRTRWAIDFALAGEHLDQCRDSRVNPDRPKPRSQ